jgi:hypothetical protein
MPITKTRLSRAEQQKYLECLEEMRAEGADVEIPSEWREESGLDIIIKDDGRTEVFESNRGGVFYAVSIRLIAKRAYVILLNCLCKTDIDDQIVLESFHHDQEEYWLGDRHYTSKEVLNDRIENVLRFSHRGQMVDGVILFSGLKLLPDHYCRGIFVPFELTFLDQFENQVTVASEFPVCREKKHKLAATQVSATGAGEPTPHLDSNLGSQPIPRRSTLFEPWASYEEYAASLKADTDKDDDCAPDKSPKEHRGH